MNVPAESLFQLQTFVEIDVVCLHSDLMLLMRVEKV